MGTFRSTSATTAGTPVTLGASAPSESSGQLIIGLCEILAGTGLAEDASSPAVVSTLSAKTASTASFTPPGGSLLVAVVSCDITAAPSQSSTIAVSDTASLTWTQQVVITKTVSGGTQQVGAIYTAPVPAVNANAPAGLASGTGTAQQAAGPDPVLAFSQALSSVTGGTLTSSSFTPATGNIVVVKAVTENSASTFNITSTPSGGGLVYTSQVSNSAAINCWTGIWTAPVTSGGTAQTVSLAGPTGGAAHWMLVVEVWAGAQLAATPATCDTQSTGAPSTTLTTATVNSVVSWCDGDYAGISGSAAYQSGATQDGLVQDTHYAAYSAYQTAPVQGSQTLGMTTPAGQTYSVLGVEIQSSLSISASPVAGLATGTGTAQTTVFQLAAARLAVGTGTAQQPVVGQSNAPAGLASGTGAAQASSLSQPGPATGTGTAPQAAAQVPGNASAGVATGTGAAPNTAFQYILAGLATAEPGGGQPNAAAVTVSSTAPLALAFSQALYSTAGGSLQTVTFTPATGSVIVVKALTEDAASFPIAGMPSGGGRTFTRQVRDSTAGNCWAGIWTAPVNSGGTPQTVQLAGPAGGATYWMMAVEVWSGAQVAGSPAMCDVRGTGVPLAAVTTTSDNSVVSWVNGDWYGTGGAVTYRSSATQDAITQNTHYSGYSAYQAAPHQGSQPAGMTAPPGQAYVLLGIEIQPVIPPGASPIAGLATGTGRAQGDDVSASFAISAGAGALATGTGAAPQAAITTSGQVNVTTGLASAAGRSQGDDVSPSFGANVSAGKVATGTGAAQGDDVNATFAVTLGIPAGLDTGTGTAQQPSTASPGNARAGLASGTGAAPQPSLTIGPITTPAAGLAAAEGTAQQALALPASLILPVVTTTAPASVTGTTVFLNGTVNPQGLATTYQFQYGLNTAYGTNVPGIPGSSGSGTTAVAESFALAGLLTSTTYHYRLTATSSAGTVLGGDQQFTTTSVAGGNIFPGPPPNPLGFKVELLLNNTWTDITKYVLQRDAAHITNMGRTDEASGIQASQMAITLKNTDGRFTPKNAAGAYYPYILRNTQIRVSVNATSPPPASAPYNGYRYWGEVSSWPPTSDISQHDVYVQLVASGIWRQVSQSTVTIGSAYARYVSQLTGVNVPAAYWTMEDGTGSTAFVISGGSGSAATFTAPPSFAQDGTSFPGSDALPQFNSARISATVSSGATPTDNVTRFALAVAAGGDGNAGQSRWCITETDSSGTVALLETFINPNGTLTMDGVASLGATPLFSVTTMTNVQGLPVLVSAELTPGGSGVTYTLNIIAPGGTSILESLTGSVSGSVGAVTGVKMNRSGVLSNTTFGQLGIFYSVPSLLTAAAAVSGWEGEFAVVRFQRLCAEFGIAAEVIGSTSPQMGPQADDTLVNIFQVIENTDGGLLYETRDQFGLGFRTLVSMQNQSPVVTLNYAAGTLGAPLAATYDDQFVKNQWQITNWDGYTALATLQSGPVSILPVPNGVGLYSGQTNANAFTHAQVNAIAQQRLFQGSVDDIRYPQVTVDLRRGGVASLFASVPSLRIGDYLQITNLPAFEGASTARQIVLGWEETLNAFTWTPVYNTAPELPFETSFSPGVYTVIQAPSGAVAQGSSIGSSVAGSQISSGAVGGITSNTTLTARSIGGVTSFVSATVPYDWSFAVSGSPSDGTYFTCTGAQAVPISAGDTFTNSAGYGGPFTVTQLAPPSGGNVSVYFTPNATTPMTTGIVSGGKNGDTWVNTAAGNQLAQWQNGAWVPIQFGPSALSFTAGGAKVTISPTAPVNPAVGDIWIDSSNGYVVKQFSG